MTIEEVKKMRAEWASNDAKRDAGLVKPEGVNEICDIKYGPYDENLLNLYFPESQGPLPVVVSIHGGGYFYGDKELYSFYCMDIAKRGFVAVDFDYRLAPENRFPAHLEDVNSVFKWILDNHEEYNLDIENVFLLGDSAGSQLTSHYAAINTNPKFAALYDFEVPAVKINAVSLACGMYDLPACAKAPENSIFIRNYFPDNFDLDDDRIKVLEHITSDFPPTYIFSAYNDFLFSQCQPMAEFLEKKGIEVECKIYGAEDKPEIAHVFHVNMRLEEGERAREAQELFFKKHIK